MARENTEQALARWQLLEVLQTSYPVFRDFLDEVMDHMGFDTSEVQHDIADFIQYGPKFCMVQAQRGQAKTTILAAYAVWYLIHNPSARVLIVSGGGKNASDTSTLITRLIQTMDILECMRPDVRAGDRISVEGFDIHHSLKGVDRTASVASVGITGTLTSRRADLLIPDDIETPKNSSSENMRQQILALSREFSDICSEGRIIYLGTPQSIDSIYNTLPSRGFTVRIWPGRYPTPEQMENYGNNLAPYILNKIKNNHMLQTGGGALGDQGQAVDERLNETILQEKEMDKGTAEFQLQYMLNTTLSDKLRYPLRTENLVAVKDPGKTFPMVIHKDIRATHLKDFSVHGNAFKMATPVDIGQDYAPLQSKVMYIDPAAGGITSQDETGYAVVGFLNGTCWLLESGGVMGGYEIDKLEPLAQVAKKHAVERVIIEKNLGYGAFKEIFMPILAREHKCAVDDDYVHGQKEKRIESILGPIIGRGSLVVLESVVEQDVLSTLKYHNDKRQLYSLFFQLSKMTLDHDSLAHDDRLDALAGACNHFVKLLAIDQQKAAEKLRRKEILAWQNDPMGRKRFEAAQKPKRGGSVFNKYKR